LFPGLRRLNDYEKNKNGCQTYVKMACNIDVSYWNEKLHTKEPLS
jgi:hypothetical protein